MDTEFVPYETLCSRVLIRSPRCELHYDEMKDLYVGAVYLYGSVFGLTSEYPGTMLELITGPDGSAH